MPWKEVNVMELRKQFVRDYKLEAHSVKDLCAMYGIRACVRDRWCCDGGPWCDRWRPSSDAP
jgi:hypothetical protein